MELIDLSMNDLVPSVFVDFAHTPEALKEALLALRLHYKREIWCVFGCGGDRDKGKRKLMGRMAKTYADRVVITSDNPRSETPESIISDILLGSKNDVHTIVNRASAINYAIRSANNADVILIAGKGHEDYQLIKDKRIEFSDELVSRKAIKIRLRELKND
jgi:UDP-N-acetylmuramoyl-L-alanyl-D-glutamate--2,6-diaminopimelate ligase